MTTQWDAERTTLLHKMKDGLQRIEWEVAFVRVATLENLIEGYRRAKAEDAALLEALKAYQAANHLHNDSEAELYDLGQAAIAQADGRK